MNLAYRYFGNRRQGTVPVIILHGLLGSSRNWTTVAKELAKRYEVFAIDLRNHGDSPHVAGMHFTALSEDLATFMDGKKIGEAAILGHSLGGKIAMRFSMDHPDRVERLIVVDIAPKTYPPYHTLEFEALNALDLKSLHSRKDADTFIQKWVPDWGMRQFLLSNLKRQDDGRWEWSIHLSALTNALDDMRSNVLKPGEVFLGPTQFIVGGASQYVSAKDRVRIQQHFPRLHYSILERVGHNPHIEATEAFLEALEL